MQHTFPLTAEDRLLQKTPFSFDASVWEFFWPLDCGGVARHGEARGHRDGEYRTEVIKERQVSILQLVPSLLQVLVEQESFRDCRSLREVFCGGEALSAAVRERFLNEWKQCASTMSTGRPRPPCM